MADADADGAAVVNVVDRYGQQQTIQLADLSRAEAQGYRLASGDEVVGQQRAEKYDQPIQAGLEGVARGVTFGLSDIGATDAQAYRKQFNPVAAGAGELAGAVGSLGVTGIGDAAAMAGKTAFGGSGILSRAGAAAVRGSVEGAAIGTGQGISDVALSKDPMTAEAIFGSISHHALVGGLVGGAASGTLSLGGSALDSAIGAAGKVVRKAADKFHGELAGDTDALATADPALRHEVMAMDAPALKAAHAAEESTLEGAQAEQAKAFAQDTGNFYRETRNDLFKLRQQLPDRQLKKVAIKASAKLENVVGNLEGLAAEPKLALEPLQRMGQQIDEMQRYLPGETLKPIADQIDALKTRAIDLMGDATSPRLEALSARLDQLANPVKTPLIDGAVKGAGAAVGGAIGHMTGIPYAGIAGAWLGKELAETVQPLARKVLGAFVDKAGAIEDGAAKILAKLKPPAAALDVLKDFATASAVEGESHYESATRAITQAAANPDQTTAAMQEQLAGLHAAAPQLAEQVLAGMQLKLNFLASKVTPQISMGLSGQLVPPSDDETATFARYVAAASDPMRLMKELRAGALMPETVETHQALYPQIKARIESALTTQLADPTVAKKVSYETRLQLAMLLGPGVDATLDPGFIALMQQPFSQPPQSAGKPPGGSSTNPSQNATEAQRLTMR